MGHETVWGTAEKVVLPGGEAFESTAIDFISFVTDLTPPHVWIYSDRVG